MQVVSKELNKLLSSRLKIGDKAKPNIRVEVDRLAFIPGRCTQLEFIVEDFKELTRIEETWIEPTSSGTYEGVTTVNSANMVFPAVGYSTSNISSPYGNRSLGGGKQQFHAGVDVATAMRTRIVSAWSGVITKVDTREVDTNWGYYVWVRHDNGYMTMYCHLDSIVAKKGQRVGAGELIAYSGNTGLCYSGGKRVTAEMRKAGRGSHLHFEVWKGCARDSIDPRVIKTGNHVDPLPYLKGTKKIHSNTVNTGSGVVVGEAVEGYKGVIRFQENFTAPDWHSKYKVSSNFKHYITHLKEAGTNSANFLFSTGNASKEGTAGGERKVSFERDVVLVSDSELSFRTASNFKHSDNDSLNVYVNDKLVRRVVNYGATKGKIPITDILVPKGNVKLKFEVVWGGKYIEPSVTTLVTSRLPKSLSIGDIKIQEVSPHANNKTVSDLDPTISNPTKSSGYWEKQEVKDFVYNNRVETVELQVGDFIYNDTLTLDNVQACEVNFSLEQECAEASITITNPNGFFNPDYVPFSFPELYQTSPWSYRINGMQIGVLSENTPIRIYLGYGDMMERVFTGLIDKVDSIGQEGILTITARDMYKKVVSKVLTETKQYPIDHVELTDTEGMDDPTSHEKVPWLKTAVVQDLADHAGAFGWRQSTADLQYPDAVVEESYLISVNQETGKVIRAVPGKEGQFEAVDITSVPTPQGWLNPYVEEYGKKFDAFNAKVSECIQDVLKDTNYRAYCDRYGTFRVEELDYMKPIVGEFTEYDNLITINKSIDYVRGRSHIMIRDEEGNYGNYIDKEMILELKGEIRTAVVEVPWAKTEEMKKAVAERMFYDMKRICRSLQVSVPGNPTLDILDRVTVVDKTTATRDTFCIKGIRHSFNVEGGYISVVDLFWSKDGVVV